MSGMSRSPRPPPTGAQLQALSFTLQAKALQVKSPCNKAAPGWELQSGFTRHYGLDKSQQAKLHKITCLQIVTLWLKEVCGNKRVTAFL